MTAITITDLENAKLDADHIADIATSLENTTTDRLGNVKQTMTGAVGAIAAINNRGAWASTNAYALKDIVLTSGNWYVCVVAHTSSGSFAMDTASKWRVYQGITSGDLAAPTGAALVGMRGGSVETVLNSQMSSASRQAASIWDDFDAPNTTLNSRVCPTGQVWQVNGPGATTTTISDGAMTNNGDNCYASLQRGSAVTHMGGTFSFSVSTVASGPQVVLIMQNASLDLNNMLHLQITPNSWSLDTRNAGVWSNSVATGGHTLATDGTQYRVSMHRSGTTLTIKLPDGKIATYTHADVAGLDLQAGTWQIQTRSAGQWVPRWHSVGIGQKTTANRSVISGAVDPGEARRIGGYGLGRRHSQQYTITADGWYRLALATTIDGFTIQGQLKLSTTGVTASQMHCTVYAKSGLLAVVTPIQVLGGYQMPNVRVGTEAAAAYIDVQIANTAASPVLLSIDFEGYVTLYPTAILSPSVPTLTVTTPVVTPGITKLSGTVAASGWARLATQTGGPGGFIMNGLVRIKAQDVARLVVMDVLVNELASQPLVPLQLANCMGRSTPITQVRISRGTNTLALDINCATAGTNTVSIEAEFFGTFSPDAALTPGVSALATEALTRTVITNRQQPVLTRVMPEGDETITYTVVTTGSTVAMTDAESGICQLSGLLSAMTVTLPPAPVNGQVALIGTQGGVTSLTVNASASHSGSFTFAAAAGTDYAFRFRSANLTWYRIR